nr:NAD(P)/FAD-dependent oxidoreductase [uncultured Desulfobacter sp.]
MAQGISEHKKTIIIGGGLSGIYAAALLLAKKQTSVVVLEARSRTGGRILSEEHNGFFADLGPSWYWPRINPKMTALVQYLGLKHYPQFEKGLGRFQAKNGRIETFEGTPMNPPGWRVEGGMTALVKGLCRQIPQEVIRLNHPVCEIEKKGECIEVSVGRHDQPPQCRFSADHGILALPPRLAARSILFTPDLSYDLTQAMLRTSTWMAGQAKFFSLYDHAPWREMGLSGQGFSLSGPIGEIHDGSCEYQAPYGLAGFARIPALKRQDKTIMIQKILEQLPGLYGPDAGKPSDIFYQDWAKEKYTATEYDLRSAHNHPEFLPPGRKTSIWEEKLHFAGSETADHMGGYLEGALHSAERAVSKIC